MLAKRILVLAGLLIGGLIGWATTPKAVDVQVGPLSIEVPGEGGGNTITATGENGKINVQVGNPSRLTDPWQRTLIFGVVGGAAGFAVGYFLERRRA